MRPKEIVRRLLKMGPSYVFRPSAVVLRQNLEVRSTLGSFSFSSAGDTPLYETCSEVLDYDCYRVAEIRDRLPHGFVCVDIGANIGISAICFARNGASRVLAVEPLERNWVLLKENCTRNAIENVELFSGVVSDRDGTVEFCEIEDESVSGSIADGHVRPGQKTIRVSSMSLASIRQRFGAFQVLKMDCEGAEYKILDDKLPDEVKVVTMEVHEEFRREGRSVISAVLRRQGFSVRVFPEMLGRPRLCHIVAFRW